MPSARELAAAAISALVGPRTGIVRELRIAETIDGDAALQHVSAAVAQVHPELTLGMRNHAAGSGTTREAAILAALGEAFERYSAACPASRLLSACEHELPGECFRAGDFAPFNDEQRAQPGFPFAKPAADSRLSWVATQSLTSDRKRWAPAFAVWLPFVPPPDEITPGPGLSTGLACGPTLDDAMERGLLEVIERDALARMWMLGQTPARLHADDLRATAGDLLPARDDVRAYRLDNEFGAVTYLVVARGQGTHGPLLSVGSACRLDPYEALRKAALEASQDRIYVRQLVKHEPDWRPAADFGNVSDFSYHARLYSVCPELTDDALAFLDGSSEIRLPAQPPAITLARVITCLQHAGHESAWADLTPPNSLGWSVVKVLIPSLLPLHGDHRLRYLGHPRLNGPVRAAPHPFP